jgi:hypothetical protein
MPKTRVGNRRFGFRQCAHGHKVQASVPDLLFKELVGDHSRLVPASFELHSKFNHRMDVACAADCGKEDIEWAAGRGPEVLVTDLSW